jgi:proteasome lid subunit RPN8/RPN11
MDTRTISLPCSLRSEMLSHVIRCFPEEACGLLAGIQGLGKAVVPIVNTLHSPVGFQMDPLEQLNAFNWMEQAGLELLAIFHSHPAGPMVPSETDIIQFAYPGVIYLIWSPEDVLKSGMIDWQIRAFDILPTGFHEVILTEPDE